VHTADGVVVTERITKECQVFVGTFAYSIPTAISCHGHGQALKHDAPADRPSAWSDTRRIRHWPVFISCCAAEPSPGTCCRCTCVITSLCLRGSVYTFDRTSWSTESLRTIFAKIMCLSYICTSVCFFHRIVTIYQLQIRSSAKLTDRLCMSRFVATPGQI